MIVEQIIAGIFPNSVRIRHASRYKTRYDMYLALEFTALSRGMLIDGRWVGRANMVVFFTPTI